MTTKTLGHEWSERATLSVIEAAEVLGLSRNSVYAAIRSGEVPSLRVGRRYLVPTAPLAEMLGLASDRSPAASESHTAPDVVQRREASLPL